MKKRKYVLRKAKILRNSKEIKGELTSPKSITDFEIREKRIGIIFKVVYVIAAILATLFLYIREDVSESVATLYAGITSFLFWTLMNLLFYVINELKCLRIGVNTINKQLFSITENSYSFIFTYFYVGIYFHLALILGVGLFGNYLTYSIMQYLIAWSVVLAAVVGNLSQQNEIIKIISRLLYSVTSYFTLYCLALGH